MQRKKFNPESQAHPESCGLARPIAAWKRLEERLPRRQEGEVDLDIAPFGRDARNLRGDPGGQLRNIEAGDWAEACLDGKNSLREFRRRAADRCDGAYAGDHYAVHL